MKNHPPHRHRKICATYLYMVNALVKISHKVVQEWSNSVLTPNHTIVLTPKHTFMQGCANVVHAYGYTIPQL